MACEQKTWTESWITLCPHEQVSNCVGCGMGLCEKHVALETAEGRKYCKQCSDEIDRMAEGA